LVGKPRGFGVALCPRLQTKPTRPDSNPAIQYVQRICPTLAAGKLLVQTGHCSHVDGEEASACTRESTDNGGEGGNQKEHQRGVQGKSAAQQRVAAAISAAEFPGQRPHEKEGRQAGCQCRDEDALQESRCDQNPKILRLRYQFFGPHTIPNRTEPARRRNPSVGIIHPDF